MTRIMEVFDEESIRGSLLILGAPGSGKTTMLLQLMKQLASRAELDDGQPIPVLVSLASWRVGRTIGDWLVAQLKMKYGVRADLGVQWRDSRSIVPLLDGLDELPAEQHGRCVEAINEFQQSYEPPRLVVCCRQAEYENLAVKLRLRGAVAVLPLEPDQIRAWLEESGSSDLWTAIRDDPALMEMARSPLLLSFMIALPDAPDRQYWQDAPSTTDRRRRLFDAYVSARTAPGADPPPYSPEQLFRWLRELATMLKRQGESEFLIERMQPEWLRSPVQRWAYRAGVLIVSASVVALALQSSVAMSAWMPRGHIGPALESSSEVFAVKHALQRPLLLVIAIALGALIASRKKIVPVETLTWSWSRATGSTLRWARTAALAGLDYGAAVGVAGTLIWEVSTFAMSGNASAWQRAGEVAGLAAGASAAVFLAFIKPSGWIGSNRRAISGRIVVALAASGIYGVITAWTLLWAVDVRAIVAFTVTVLAVTAAAFAIPFSIPLDHRFRVRLLNALWAGVTGGAVIGAFSGVALSASVSFIPWLNVWLTGGLAGGTAVGIAIGLLPRARDWLQKTKTGDAADVQRSWKRTAAAALPIAVSLGVAAMVSVRLGHEQAVRNVAHFMVTFGMGFLMPLAFAFLTAIACALSGAVTAGILGALAGALGGGAAGADVERRLVPNQGIRQSARNVVIFGALGALIVGLPYGLLNLSVAAAFTRSIPTGADVLGLGVAPGLTLGILAGLLPGAACIQHFVLRLMLWASGTLPLRAVGFLNFATRRRLLQRVGGRYRFIHVLLRDHLGERSPARTVA